MREREAGGAFRDVEDLARGCRMMNRREMAQMARIGALNSLGGVEHRRDAVWQVEQASAAGGAAAEGEQAREAGGIAAAADVDRGAAGGGLCRDGADGGAAPDGLSAGGAASTRDLVGG